MASTPLDLATISRLPAPGDNVAIVTRQLEAGTVLAFPEGPRVLAHGVLEGHRFAVKPIAADEDLLSWGLPFGTALTAIAPGDYVCNRSMLDGLAVRRVPGLVLPATPNFKDKLEPFSLDEASFRPAPPVERVTAPRTFMGYRRPGRRGVGTRNFIVILGTTSRTASYARQLTARLQPLARVHPGIDGIVAIAHTEGAGPGEPNNTAEVLRCLAGFITHPNVAAVLAVDYGIEPITNARLRAFMEERGDPLAEVPHQFLSLSGGLAAGLAEGERIVRGWLPAAHACVRTPEPISGLRIALQCGGSDAFSGVSGNPLAGALVYEALRHGGSGNLCETDEVMGAESYIFRGIGDLVTARKLVTKLEAFKQRLAWHGLTPEANPSAGNKFRGLYNIALKSLGAAHKKDPRVRIDRVIDYAEPMEAPGFYFMNSPGNDLEGIAGQVAAGCNLFLFVTGNGSITNFPFVPTLKVTTTTRRHQLLIHEMDINAGRYLDGERFDDLVAEYFDLVVDTVGGRRTKGEHAGHSQVSLWRNWRQTDTSRLAALRARVAPDGQPLTLAPAEPTTAPGVGPDLRAGRSVASSSPLSLELLRTEYGWATERVGLVLPTSLCASQIARLAADRLNARGIGRAAGLTRFVALPHTEGCGFGGETMYHLLHRTYRGYITHPNVAAALLLEHGCEKIPNDVMRRQLETAGIPLTRFGWGSVQLDGGIEKALEKIEAHFTEKLAMLPPAPPLPTTLGALTVGFMAASRPSSPTVDLLAMLAREILDQGGSVLIPQSDALLADSRFTRALIGDTPAHATLLYGQPLPRPGLHIVSTETDHWVENVTGLAGCGAHLVLGVVSEHARQGHPLIPVVQIAEPTQRGRFSADDIDLFLSEAPEDELLRVEELLVATAERTRLPVAIATGSVDFQLTRGELGVST